MAGESRNSCRVAVAILNWNGEAHLRRFLPSVVAHASPEDVVVVIDNGSDDGSLRLLQEEFSEVEVIRLDRNHGFSGGYNRGLDLFFSRCDAEWFLLLNSDVEVTAGWVDGMLSACEHHGWAAAQPKIRAVDRRAEFEYAGAAGGYMDRYGFMFCAGRIFNTFEVDRGQYDGDREVFWASGAALLVRARVWREVGGLDEDFFAHMEEIDLCWRMRNRGYAVGVATGAHVYHLGGGTLAQSSPRKAQLNFRNNLYLLLKNDHRPGISRRLLWRMIIDGVAALRFLAEGKVAFFKAVWNAHGEFRQGRKHMMQKRQSEIHAVRGCAEAPRVAGEYGGDIIVDYFLRGRKRWSDLPGALFR